MPRTLFSLFILSSLAIFGLFGTTVHAQDDIHNHRQCTECGMDRKAYGFSRMLVIFADGKEVGVCSLHCAVETMNRHKDQTVQSLLAADRNTHKLIPAEQAIWVLGGKKRGVMTMRAKWAFITKETAQDFIKDYGGKIVSWEETLSAASADALAKSR